MRFAMRLSLIVSILVIVLIPLRAVPQEMRRRNDTEEAVSQSEGTEGQGTEKKDAINLPEVTVEGAQENEEGGFVAEDATSATKTDTPIIEIPQSISVITRDQMDVRDALTVDQALRYTPGVVGESGGSDNRFEDSSLRGFRLDEYLDGLKLPYVLGFTFPRIDPYFLDCIEVYYGPASVLYGQATPGGLINLVSKRPTAYSFYHFQFQTGYYGLAQGAFDIGGPIDKDGQFLFRLTGLARETETQVKHTQNERLAIAPALTWQPGPDTTLTILGSYLYDPQEFGFNELPLEGTAFPNPNGKIPSTFFSGDADFDRFKRSQYYLGYMFEQRLGDRVVLSQNFRFLHQNVYYNLVWPLGFEPDLRTMDRIAQKTRENLDVLTIDNHAQVKLNTGPVKHTLLAGLDYQYFWWNQRFGDTEGPPLDYLDPDYFQPIPDFPFASKAQQKQDQLGLYLQDQAQAGDLFLLLGARYDWADTKTRRQDLIDDTVANEKEDDHAFTWRAGAVYVLNIGLAPYFSYSESFLPTAGTDISGNPFKPTRGRQYEAGIKYQPEWFNGFFTAAVYNLTETNVLTADPENPFFSIQTGEIRSRGIELSGVASPVKGLDMTAAYSYLDNKVTKADDGTQGKHPVGIPDNTASVWANYMFPYGYLAGFGIGGGVRYYGASWGDSFNTFKIPGATIVDAVAQYDFGALFSNLKGLGLAVNASNLFDKHYLAFCQDFGCYYGLNRNVQVSINYNW